MPRRIRKRPRNEIPATRPPPLAPPGRQGLGAGPAAASAASAAAASAARTPYPSELPDTLVGRPARLEPNTEYIWEDGEERGWLPLDWAGRKEGFKRQQDARFNTQFNSQRFPHTFGAGGGSTSPRAWIRARARGAGFPRAAARSPASSRGRPPRAEARTVDARRAAIRAGRAAAESRERARIAAASEQLEPRRVRGGTVLKVGWQQSHEPLRGGTQQRWLML